MQILGRTKSQTKTENPKVVTNLLFVPNAKLFQISALVKNDPNIIAKLGSYLSESLHVLHGEVDSMPGKEFASVHFFVEAKNPNLTRDSIEKLLSSSPLTLNCIVAEGRDGLILDKQQFPLKLSSGHRAMFMTGDAFRSMMGRIRTVFSTGGKLIIYEEGLASGKINASQLLHVFGQQFVFDHVEELIYLYSITGMGVPEIVMMDFDQKKAIIRLYENLECLEAKTDKPFSEYIRGHICGIGNILFNIDTKCTETKCIAMGHEFCEFELRPVRENS